MQHNAKALPRNSRHHAYTGGVVNWRTAAVHVVAKMVGLCVKIEGAPLGSTRNLEMLPTASNCIGAGLVAGTTPRGIIG